VTPGFFYGREFDRVDSKRSALSRKRVVDPQLGRLHVLEFFIEVARQLALIVPEQIGMKRLSQPPQPDRRLPEGGASNQPNGIPAFKCTRPCPSNAVIVGVRIEQLHRF
jgi:hypothetical protein